MTLFSVYIQPLYGSCMTAHSCVVFVWQTTLSYTTPPPGKNVYLLIQNTLPKRN